MWKPALVVMVLVLSTATPAFAQVQITPQPSASTSANPALINPVGSLSAIIQDDKNQYAQNLETYRNGERLYMIDRQQFVQLQTLASLEAAVQATRQVMLSRIDVLQSYVKLLRDTLANTPGIDLGTKNDQLQHLDQLSVALKTHRSHVSLANDRPSIANMVTEFATLEPAVETLTNGTVELISYGKIQSLYDKTISLENDIHQDVANNEQDPLRLAEKQRGFDEITRELTQVSGSLQTTQQDLQKARLNGSQFNQQSFNDTLTTIYGGISRSLNLLEEALQN